MNINTIKELTKLNIKGQLSNKNVQSIIWSGKPGVGKSRAIEAITKELNCNYLDYSLPSIVSENLSGIPNFIDAPDMTKYSISGSKLAQATDWSVPMLIMEANRMANEPGKDGCVLVIEDIHETSMGVMPYFYALLEDRRLGTYKLDDKVAIVGTMNDSDEAGFSGIPSPIKDRCSIVNISFIFDDWYNSHGKYLNYLISSFIKLHPQYIQEQESTGVEQFLTPRSCTYFGSELDLYTPEFILANAKDLAEMKMSKSA